MWTLSASAIQACLSLVFLLALRRLESGRGILLTESFDSSQLASATDPESVRRSGRHRRMKGVLWLLLIASTLATLCELSPMVEEWLR